MTDPHRDQVRDAEDAGELLEEIRALLEIPGVEGIGRPVTVLSPLDLPPDFPGLVERLRAGTVEDGEEMILPTLPATPGPRRGEHPAAGRLRRSVLALCRDALGRGAPAGDLAALLGEIAREVGGPDQPRGGGS